jgi:SAM-dependent methyltransferase
VSLLDRKEHFEFGENWRDYAATLDRPRIDQAIAGLRRLFPEGLSGKTFLDIGCGSGLHSLAALELGAASVHAVDLDENSVAAARSTLTRFADGRNWSVEQRSVFDLAGRFDVVYSWGVLHHTGAMWPAIDHAATLLGPGGLFAIAIYTRTPHCDFWRVEKRFYSRAPAFIQAPMRWAYMVASFVRDPRTVINYKQMRGMNFSHDVHDWLGGYPYESASVEEVASRLARLGLEEVRTFAVPAGRGILGSGCSEYVYRRPR